MNSFPLQPPKTFLCWQKLFSDALLRLSESCSGGCKGLIFCGNSLLNGSAGLKVSGHTGGVELFAC
ncbi:hypothetical protein BCF46_3113 [Litoreibacter meonggei]|uniref:Uncharacterized protein n=1 Tax=Litoreibacter meonggei TaxID=1049199 RepID=A0A497VCJ4_9RHOB|nr:hypothetical protein BCF46_3113 [Litoreibacter meonggei]